MALEILIVKENLDSEIDDFWKIHQHYNIITKLDNHAKITVNFLYRSPSTIPSSD